MSNLYNKHKTQKIAIKFLNRFVLKLTFTVYLADNLAQGEKTVTAKFAGSLKCRLIPILIQDKSL